MKTIFVGSSKESLYQAECVASILNDCGVIPLLWTNIFKNGDITLLRIEEISRKIDGAVLIAAPDDISQIRGKKVFVPRTNVIFEYGYFSSIFTRQRVALLCYDGVELPSDFRYLTHIHLGQFKKNTRLGSIAKAKIREWALRIPAIQKGIDRVSQMHGYSGKWEVETNYSIWRNLKILNDNYAYFNGYMVLAIPFEEDFGYGGNFGKLQVKIDDCYAEFDISDEIIGVKINKDGDLFIKSESKSRNRIILHGSPPQKDGFEEKLIGIRVFEAVLQVSNNSEKTLSGRYCAKIGNTIVSEAHKKAIKIF